MLTGCSFLNLSANFLKKNTSTCELNLRKILRTIRHLLNVGLIADLSPSPAALSLSSIVLTWIFLREILAGAHLKIKKRLTEQFSR